MISSSVPPQPKENGDSGGENSTINNNDVPTAPQHPTVSEDVPTEGSTPVESFIEAQKTFQKFASQITGFDQRNPFHLSSLSPFLLALQQHQQQQQQNFQMHHLFGCLNGVAPLSNANQTGAGSVASSCSGREVSQDRAIRGMVDEDGEEYDEGEGEAEDLRMIERPLHQRRLQDGTVEGDFNEGTANNWSYEEQFKQLYQLSDDPKRKEWLDDWLAFMHRIGKPVTRIPIMAKQVLDLFELYRLVVQHGGLVEIINKKLWREITKGLNLPNSITSAAFTLRSQYQKYLYDYECEHHHLSTQHELDAAIDSNKREGRRNHAIAPPSASATPVGNSGGGGTASVNNNNQHLHHTHSTTGSPFTFPLMTPNAVTAALFGPGAKNMGSVFGLKSADDESVDTGNALTRNQQSRADDLNKAAQQRQLELFQRAALEAVNYHRLAVPIITPNNTTGFQSQSRRRQRYNSNNTNEESITVDGQCSKKKMRVNGVSPSLADSIPPPTNDNSHLPSFGAIEKLFKDAQSSHLKSTSTTTQNGDSSMVVSMEVNGVMYQGILFATNTVTAASVSSTTGSPSSAPIPSRHDQEESDNNNHQEQQVHDSE